MYARTTEALDAKVDLLKLLESYWGMSRTAATRIIMDGQLEIDHHRVEPEWAVKHWTVGQLYGRMMYCRQCGYVRLFGSRLDFAVTA